MSKQFELEKAIITKLKASSLWLWDIYNRAPSDKGVYLEMNVVNTTSVGPKAYPVDEVLVSFDAWDSRPSARAGTNYDVLHLLDTAAGIITLDSTVAGTTALTVTGYTDISHARENGPEVVPNIDPSITHAAMKIKFTIEG